MEIKPVSSNREIHLPLVSVSLHNRGTQQVVPDQKLCVCNLVFIQFGIVWKLKEQRFKY